MARHLKKMNREDLDTEAISSYAICEPSQDTIPKLILNQLSDDFLRELLQATRRGKFDAAPYFTPHAYGTSTEGVNKLEADFAESKKPKKRGGVWTEDRKRKAQQTRAENQRKASEEVEAMKAEIESLKNQLAEANSSEVEQADQLSNEDKQKLFKAVETILSVCYKHEDTSLEENEDSVNLTEQGVIQLNRIARKLNIPPSGNAELLRERISLHRSGQP